MARNMHLVCAWAGIVLLWIWTLNAPGMMFFNQVGAALITIVALAMLVGKRR